MGLPNNTPGLPNYTPGHQILTINGRRCRQFGDDSTPVKFEFIDDLSKLKRGQGGTAARGSRVNPGMRLTLHLMPGGTDSAFLSGTSLAGSDYTATWTTIGTGEALLLEEGVLTKIGEIGRGGDTPSDDVYIFEFNKTGPIKLGSK